MKTARSEQLVLCHDCRLLVRSRGDGSSACPRCGSPLHQRRPHSLARTWAFVIAAWVAMAPANLYPIMTVVYFGDGEPDTIASGVMRLAEEGMLPIAMLVFVASIAVPVLKLLGIMLLLLTIHFRWALNKMQCMILYRIIEVIGAWSMLDLFMISILVTLADLGAVAQVSAGPGASAFAMVVVLTMLAAISFDPRLIWDLQEEAHD
ncbi:MAG: paraquat-inducible protein A [Pseudomonadota bacterium]|nr:paraquat-inducible membrane protein A [Pseudomonadales bacterium]MDY6919500.1 paraquat-inducible protein A [Pseudomonadota bacterium]